MTSHTVWFRSRLRIAVVVATGVSLSLGPVFVYVTGPTSVRTAVLELLAVLFLFGTFARNARVLETELETDRYWPLTHPLTRPLSAAITAITVGLLGPTLLADPLRAVGFTLVALVVVLLAAVMSGVELKFPGSF